MFENISERVLEYPSDFILTLFDTMEDGVISVPHPCSDEVNSFEITLPKDCDRFYAGLFEFIVSTIIKCNMSGEILFTNKYKRILNPREFKLAEILLKPFKPFHPKKPEICHLLRCNPRMLSEEAHQLIEQHRFELEEQEARARVSDSADGPSPYKLIRSAQMLHFILAIKTSLTDPDVNELAICLAEELLSYYSDDAKEVGNEICF